MDDKKEQKQETAQEKFERELKEKQDEERWLAELVKEYLDLIQEKGMLEAVKTII